ncbi:glucan endo-1,3-beta-glucosidase 12 isoform X2 [Abrus precatorius]|uniref:glucan endo-1,3-beta-D-glucosidase n=1 Tax=Abrus precatorius TaxID=3816 RepID=A0A8B8JFC5_ABRPR|nr:glucan endo-1,3-beta-glucosidase 12 isoform X2 [Abrus precatorius]
MLCFTQKQSMASLTFSFSLFFMLTTFYASSSEAGSIGINYGRVANDLPTPAKVVELLKTQGLNRVKLYDTDATVLNAFANSGIKVVVAMPNELLSNAAADQSFTDAWVQANISKYYPATQIEAIAVGNEVFVDPNNTTKFLVPAMNNVHASLSKYNLDSNIKISSPIALSALQTSYPTSSGAFKTELVEQVIKPMLDFLRKTGSYLMVNAYPFFAYSANSDTIALNYALFKDNPGVVDSGNGLRYTNLFDAQVDAVFAAMSALQYDDVKIEVSETGWPSAGDSNEIGAGPDNAASYNGNLVRRVLGGSGTPLRPKDPLNVFLFALFNENQKQGPTSERNYGLFYPSEQKVYDIPLTVKEVNEAPSNSVSKSEVPVSTTSFRGQTWCVANGASSVEKLANALNYACGEGGADCTPIQPDATCYNPNTLEAHASYAFNSYYQKKSRATGTCDFGGTAYVVTQPPKYGNCEFPTGY